MMDTDFSEQMNNNNIPAKPISLDEFVLEHVHGVTVPDKNGIAASPVTDQVAYAADRILVILNPITSQQMFIETPSVERSIACVAFSNDGRLVGFAEQGPKPYVSIWLVREFKVLNKFQITEYKRGPSCIKFHPKKPFIIMLSQEEPRILVYDYIRGVKSAIAILKSLLYDMDISQDGTYLLVCGYRKIRYYTLTSIDDTKNAINILQTKRTVSVGHDNSYRFIGITCGKSRDVYAITSCGVLCKMKLRGIYIEKEEKIDKQLSCLCYGLDLLFLGCCNSTVKMCYPEDLSVAAVISLSEMLGPEIRIPGLQDVTTQGIVLSEAQSTITCVYSDYNIYSWQLKGDNESIECNFILPSYLKKTGPEDSEAYGTLKQELFKTSILKQYLSGPSQGATVYAGFKEQAKQPNVAPPHGGCEPNAVKISPDCRDIVVGDEKGELKIYEASTGVIRKVIEAHNSKVTYIEMMYNDQHKLVCSGGRDRVIFILDAADSFNLVQVLCAHSSAIKAIKLLHVCSELTLVSASVDGVVLIWQSPMDAKPKFHVISQIFDLISKTHANIMLDCTQSYFVKGDKNGSVQLLNMEPDHTMLACKSLQKNKNSPGGIKGLDIDPSGSFLAVGFVNGYTTVYHLQSGQIVATLSTQRDLQSIKFAKDLSYMIIFSKHCALVWKLPERMEEYMRSRLLRENQSAAGGETEAMPFDTFLKSSRVVRGTSESETSFASGDRTPTIRTMNLLNASRSMSSIKNDLSASSSSLSMSSSSSHTHLENHYTSSDASVRMNSLPDVNVKSLQSIYSGKKRNVSKDRSFNGPSDDNSSVTPTFGKTCIQRRIRSASYDGTGTVTGGSCSSVLSSRFPLDKTRNSLVRNCSSHSYGGRAIIKTTSQSSALLKKRGVNNRPPIGNFKNSCVKTSKLLPPVFRGVEKSPVMVSVKLKRKNILKNDYDINDNKDIRNIENTKSDDLGKCTLDIRTNISSETPDMLANNEPLMFKTNTPESLNTNDENIDSVNEGSFPSNCSEKGVSDMEGFVRAPYFLNKTRNDTYESSPYTQINTNESKCVDYSETNEPSEESSGLFSDMEKYSNEFKHLDPNGENQLTTDVISTNERSTTSSNNYFLQEQTSEVQSSCGSILFESQQNTETDSLGDIIDCKENTQMQSSDLNMTLDSDSLASLLSICNQVCNFGSKKYNVSNSVITLDNIDSQLEPKKRITMYPKSNSCGHHILSDDNNVHSKCASESSKTLESISEQGSTFNAVVKESEMWENAKNEMLPIGNAISLIKQEQNIVSKGENIFAKSTDLDEITGTLLGNTINDSLRKEQNPETELSNKRTLTPTHQNAPDISTLSFTQRHRLFANKTSAVLKTMEKEQNNSNRQLHNLCTQSQQSHSKNSITNITDEENRCNDKLMRMKFDDTVSATCDTDIYTVKALDTEGLEWSEVKEHDSYATLFKQDDYLKRLRDIRDTFEKNIFALQKDQEHPDNPSSEEPC